MSFELPVSKNEIWPVLRETDAFCILFHSREIYKYGISANKLFDYLIVGRPIIIALDADYNPVKKAQAGICIPPQDPEALADAILALKEMTPEERQIMGQRARAYASEKHDTKLLGARLAHVMKELVVARLGQS